MALSRVLAAGALAAVVTCGLMTGTASAGSSAGCYGIGGGKYNCNVWKTAPSYECTTTQETDSCSGQRVGWLYAGTNYFYCQTWGHLYQAEGYYNHYWALTDDDTGHRSVWVPVVYISGGVNDGAIPGLPFC